MLTPLQDDDLVETLDLVLAGIHAPAQMPFTMPWTDAPRDELIANTLRYCWTSRGGGTPESWSLPFVVRSGGVLVGMQDLVGEGLRRHQTVEHRLLAGRGAPGRGIGTEMRDAVLQFAFDHLGGRGRTAARSSTTRRRCGCPRSSATGRTAPRCCSGGPGSAPWSSG